LPLLKFEPSYLSKERWYCSHRRDSCHYSNSHGLAFYRGGSFSIPGDFLWWSWRAKWRWSRFSLTLFGFPLLITMHLLECKKRFIP